MRSSYGVGAARPPLVTKTYSMAVPCSCMASSSASRRGRSPWIGLQQFIHGGTQCENGTGNLTCWISR